jgi:hypothetical protein
MGEISLTGTHAARRGPRTYACGILHKSAGGRVLRNILRASLTLGLGGERNTLFRRDSPQGWALSRTFNTDPMQGRGPYSSCGRNSFLARLSQSPPNRDARAMSASSPNGAVIGDIDRATAVKLQIDVSLQASQPKAPSRPGETLSRYGVGGRLTVEILLQSRSLSFPSSPKADGVCVCSIRPRARIFGHHLFSQCCGGAVVSLQS